MTDQPKDSYRQFEFGVPVRVASGYYAGALVVIHFVNRLGNLDCRFAEDFGQDHYVIRKGEIVVIRPSDMGGAE
jgi:hypothetical protein